MMLIIGFLGILMAVILYAVWSAYQDLKRRDLTPQMPPSSLSNKGDWPPAPKGRST